MDVTKKDGNLIIVLPLGLPRPSRSRKTWVLASSRGAQQTSVEIDGHLVHVVAKAFINKESPRIKWGNLLSLAAKEKPQQKEGKENREAGQGRKVVRKAERKGSDLSTQD
jgi:hypothetical protein